MRIRRWWVVAGGLLLLLAAGALLAIFNLERALNENRGWVASRVEAVIGRPVAFGDVGLSFRGGLGVGVEDVHVGEDPAFGEGDFARAERVEVRVKIWPALFGRVEVRELVVREPWLRLVRSEQGWNAASVGRGASPQEGSTESDAAPRSEAAAEASGESRMAALLVALVDIRDGRVEVEDRTARPPLALVADQIDLQVSDWEPERALELAFSAAVLGASDVNLRVTGEAGPLDPNDAEASPVDLAIEFDPVDWTALARFPELREALPAGASLEGESGLALSLKGPLSGVDYELALDLTKTALGTEAARKPAGERLRIDAVGRASRERVEVSQGEVVLADAEVAVGGQIELGGSVRYDLRLQSEGLPLSGWGAFLPALAKLGLGGAADLDVQARGGSGGLPVLDGKVSLEDFAVSLAGAPPIAAGRGELTLEAGGAVLRPFAFELAGSPAELEATLPKLSEPRAALQLSVAELRAADFGVADPKAARPEGLQGVSVDGDAASGPAGASFRGTLRADTGRIRDVDLAELVAPVTWDAGRASWSDARFRALEGRVTSSGKADLSGEAPRFDVATRAQDVRIEQLVTSRLGGFSKLIEGRLTGDIALAGAGSEWQAIRRVLTGDGRLELQGGALRDVNLADSVLGALTGVPGLTNLLSPKLRAKHPAIFDDAETRFDALQASLEIADGRITVPNLLLSAKDYGVRATGGVGLDGGLAMDAVLVASKGLNRSLRSELSQLSVLEGPSGRIEIPFQVEGTWPRLAAQPDVARVSQSLQRALVSDALGDLLGLGKKAPRKGKKAKREKSGQP